MFAARTGATAHTEPCPQVGDGREQKTRWAEPNTRVTQTSKQQCEGRTAQHDHNTLPYRTIVLGQAGDRHIVDQVRVGWGQVRGVTLSGWGSNSRVFLSCRFHTRTEPSALPLANTLLQQGPSAQCRTGFSLHTSPALAHEPPSLPHHHILIPHPHILTPTSTHPHTLTPTSSHPHTHFLAPSHPLPCTLTPTSSHPHTHLISLFHESPSTASL